MGMRTFKIIKGSLVNYVDEALYNKLYKPNGWVIDDSEAMANDEATNDVKVAKTDTELKNLKTMKTKKKSTHKFDDNLFKSDKEE